MPFVMQAVCAMKWKCGTRCCTE